MGHLDIRESGLTWSLVHGAMRVNVVDDGDVALLSPTVPTGAHISHMPEPSADVLVRVPVVEDRDERETIPDP